MHPAIFNAQTLEQDESVVSSIVPVTIGASSQATQPFSFSLAAFQRIYWELNGIFTLGATGGFRFQANTPAGFSIYNAVWNLYEDTTPNNFEFIFPTSLGIQDATNASGVADNYIVRAYGAVTNGATPGTFALQYAQNNSTANPITMLAGLCMKVWQF